MRRYVILAAKLAIVGLVVWGVHRTVGKALDELEQHEWSPRNLRPGWLAASGVLYLAGLFPSAWFWHRVLCALGQSPKLFETVRAYYIGHLGKYVPGKALVIVLRTGLIRSTRVETSIAAVSIFYETLTMMAVGSFVGGALLAFWFRHEHFLMLAALGMMLVSGLPTLPPVFRRIVTIAAGKRVNSEALDRLKQFRYSTLALGWVGIAVGWVLNGMSIYAAIAASGFAVTPDSTEKLLLCIIAGALSTVAGFLSFIPAGAVVREAVLIELFRVPFGDLAALVSSIVFRLVSLVAELLISVILYGSGPRRPVEPPPP